MAPGTSDMASQVRVVLVTVPDADVGYTLARRVVGEQLAACGNVIPGLTSVYRWDGEMQEDSEALVLFKTTDRVLPALKRRVAELHPYEIPEFLAFPVADGNVTYLKWVVGEVSESGRPE